MHIYVLSSGSKGNATLLCHRNHVILIDMGLSLTKLNEELSLTPYRKSDIEAVLVTHEHGDHTSGLRFFDESIIYAVSGAIPLLPENCLSFEQTYEIASFKITPIKTSHDAPNSCGYLIEDDCSSLAYMTDTGYICENSLELLKNKEYYIIESNHNVKELLKTNRPPELKHRILSDVGHLSNEDSALYVSRMIGKNTKQIILAHLSEEANSPELALSAYLRILTKRRININKLDIKTAKQFVMVEGGD